MRRIWLWPTLLALTAACRAAPQSSGRSPAEAPQQDIASTKVAPAPRAPASTPEPPPAPTASAAASTTAASVSVTISTPRPQIELGHSLPLQVEFKNQSAATATFREPSRTWELTLRVFRPDEPSNTPAIRFGKVFYETHGPLARRTIEDAARISLQPGEVYAFVEDVGNRWPQLFAPGTHQLQVIDRAVTPATTSNVITVQVLFTEASMPKLFEFAERWLTEADLAWQSSEAGFIGEARQFAARWIAELQPGFRLDADPDDPAAERQNRAAIAAARAQWEKQAGSAETRAKIAAINRSAGQGR